MFKKKKKKIRTARNETIAIFLWSKIVCEMIDSLINKFPLETKKKHNF